MGNFNRGGFGGRGRSYRGPREMHKAICSRCGKECEVPFRPTGEKPVYCQDCFREINGTESRHDNRNFSHPTVNNQSSGNIDLQNQLAALSTKVDKILSILESEKIEEPVAVEKKKMSPKKSA